MMKTVLIVGLGNVGAAYAGVLKYSTRVQAIGYDINTELVEAIKKDEKHALYGQLKNVYSENKFEETISCVLVCMSTNSRYDRIDASNITEMLLGLELDKDVPIIIKSAVPIGYCSKLKKDIANPVFYCPEMLREGETASRDIWITRHVFLSYDSSNHVDIGEYISEIYPNGRNISRYTFEELETLKLARNTYFGLRVSFFNEIHRICDAKDVNISHVMHLLGLDPLIGDHYNDVSFGFGGYCLPKDINELDLSVIGYHEVIPVISNITRSNDSHIEFHVKRIIEMAENTKTIVFYGVGFKKGSSNITNSATVRIIIKLLTETDKEIKVIDSTNTNFSTGDTRIKHITEREIEDGDMIVTEWDEKYVHSLISDKQNCIVYHPKI